MKDLLIIAGPTASGKSSFALSLASLIGGEIINADSMQVYDAVPHLTAQPDEHELKQCPHHLYSVLNAQEVCSAARWRSMVLDVLPQCKHPILVGGTGLYIRSLINGLSPVPDVPCNIRAAARESYANIGAEAFYTALCQKDPLASRLNPGDQQRIIRASEVFDTTGLSIFDWQQKKGEPYPGRVRMITLMPPKPTLDARIQERFESMMHHGAVGEVRRLLDLDLAPACPVMKAIGVPELSSYIRGKCTKEHAIQRAIITSRQYAKRQLTWFRHQIKADLVIPRFPNEEDLLQVKKML